MTSWCWFAISASTACANITCCRSSGRACGLPARGKVVGLSKLARVVEEVSHRPQVQERMTHQIADLLQLELDPKGVVVVIEASHSCMTIRGIRKPGSLTITSAVRGLFKSNQASRAEVMAFIQGKRGD